MPEVVGVPELTDDVELLVIWPQTEPYVSRLSELFPAVRVRGAVDWDSAPSDLEGTQILVSHGRGLSDKRLAQMPRLAWLQVLSSGTEHLAGLRAARPDLLMTSTSGIHGPQMAESALLHMLALSRAMAFVARERLDHVWATPGVVTALERKTVVIVGMGTSGLRLARVCSVLDMTVHAVTRSPREIEGVSRCFSREQLPEAVSGADYVVLAMPVEEDTRALFGRELLEAMKPTAFLVNIARGAVVDEPALIEALRSGEIAGAGLDVFAVEPLPADSPLWDMDNVFITPHIAGRSETYNERALEVVVVNLERYLAGAVDELRNVIA
jgi:D-2-hydroxyacid dehydrogenase (NADP+)